MRLPLLLIFAIVFFLGLLLVLQYQKSWGYKTNNTILYLLYNDEDISAFTHRQVIPLQIKAQNEYFESQAFREIGVLPDVENIGFITPSFFRKQKLTLDELFLKVGNGPLHRTLGLVEAEDNRLAFLTKFHGENFITIWRWLISELGYKDHINTDFKGFAANTWVSNRAFVVNFIKVARRAMDLCDNAPPHIKELLYSDTHYNGSVKHKMQAKFGIPHYPFHPFILENLACFLAHLE
jgi:hypothetical protein